MRVRLEDTPPSSINGDEISPMEDEYFEEVEEIDLDDDEAMEELFGPEDYEDIEPPEDLSSLVFSEHAGSVFCCDIHRDGKIAVTGGEDDIAYVWSIDTGKVIMKITGHKDSVIFVGFSFDGTYLATGDMGGYIKVHKVNLDNEEPWATVFEYETDDLSFGLWHFGVRVLICGVETGDIYAFKIPSMETKVLQGHNVKVECAKIFNDGVRLVAGYEDGTIKVWDLKNCSVISQIPANTHDNRVTAVDIHPDSALVASISSDGKLIMSTSTNGKVIHQHQVENDLETVAFSNTSLGYFALGTLTGAVSIWDTAKQMVRHQCEQDDEESHGVTKMIWIKNYLVTGCLDGSVRVYESRSGERKTALTGHRSAILDLCYNEKANLILTTSDDNTARIFKYEVNNDND